MRASAFGDSSITRIIYPGERYGLDGCLTYELNAYSGVPAAALSRFALPENRKAALNVIRKLNESRDSNDNAL